jgi:hypothetical protein
MVHVGVVINVCDIRYIRNIRVRDVDLSEIALADSVGRSINFAVPQRNPAQIVPTSADPNGNPEVRSTKEGD